MVKPSPASSVTTGEPKKKSKREKKQPEQSRPVQKMKTAMDVVNRIIWDGEIVSEAFVIGYLDRFVGIVEKKISEFNFKDDISTLSHLEFSIPQHRIQYIKYLNIVVWDKRKESRVDNFFGSYTHNRNSIPAKTIEEIVAANPVPQHINSPTPQASPTTMTTDRPNYFICCRVLQRKVKQFAMEFQTSDQVIYEGRLDQERFHFTILTLRLRNELEVSRAQQALSKFDLAATINPEQPILIRGLDCFRGRVVFAGLDSESSARIVFLHEKLRNHMIRSLGSKCWKGQDRERFIPHMTISKISRPMAREGKFFHEVLYNKKSTTPIGFTKVRALHLCKMQPPKEADSFYEVVETKLNIPRLLASANDGKPVQASLDLEKDCLHRATILAQQAQAASQVNSDRTFLIVRGPLSEARQYVDDQFPSDEISRNPIDDIKDAKPLVILVSSHPKTWYYNLELKFAKCHGYNISIVDLSFQFKTCNQLYDMIQFQQSWEAGPNAPCFVSTSVPSSTSHLYIFDMDKTLLMTPDAPRGQSPGLWVTFPLSLVEKGTRGGPCLEAYYAAKHSEDAFIVVLTGRKLSLEKEVKDLLRCWGIEANCVVLKDDPGQSTANYKANVVRNFVETGLFKTCEFYDDDYDCLRSVERVLDRIMSESSYTVHDAHLMGTISQCPIENGFDEVEKWLTIELAHIITSTTGVVVSEPKHLSMRFGSFVLGRTTSDLDICLFMPDHETDLLEKLYKTVVVKKGAAGAFVVKGSHFSKGSRCPRISLLIEKGQEELELDIISTRLGTEFFKTLCPKRSQRFIRNCLNACKDDASARALTGLLMSTRLEELLVAVHVPKSRFLHLLEETLSLLEKKNLRGAHFHMIKTFQVVLLLEEYVRHSNGKDMSFTKLCRFLGSLEGFKWERVLRGVYVSPDVNEAACNLAYMDRLIASFQNPNETIEFETLTSQLFKVLLFITSPSPWKTHLQLQASFPAAVRSLQDQGVFIPNGVPLKFEKPEEQKYHVARIEFAVGKSRSNVDQLHQVLSTTLKLPMKSTIRCENDNGDVLFVIE